MLFERSPDTYSSAQRRRYALYEIAYTIIDFSAALLFVIGSILFFSEEWQTPGTWCFLIGSLFFAAKPTLRLVREIRLAAMGDASDLAKKFED